MTLPAALPPGVVNAPPLWTIDAEANAEHIARTRHAARAAAEAAALVTSHPTPWFGEPVPAAALTLKAAAERVGMRTLLRSGLDWCVLEGRVGEQRLGFSARWVKGRADAALWYSPTDEWGTTHDDRPGPDAKVERRVKGKVTLVAHPNRMPRGLARNHLVHLASPRGVVVPFAELGKRVRALG